MATPPTLDLTPRRVALNDTTEFVNKINGLQTDLEGYASGLTSFAAAFETEAQAHEDAAAASSVVATQQAALAATAVPVIEGHAMTKAEWMARAAANRDRYAGSGFVEWGKNVTEGAFFNVNDGLTPGENQIANTVHFGRSGTSQIGVSRTAHPVVNINGVQVAVRGCRSSEGPWANLVTLPPAPAATNLVTNGTFDTDTSGWTDSSVGTGSVTWSGGRVEIGGPDYANRGDLRQDFATVAGQTYLLEAECSQDNEAYVVVEEADTGASILIHPVTKLAPVRVEFVAVDNLTRVHIRGQGGTCIFDNVSVIDKAALSRQDLVFLESWHEKITDKDFVYPYGNVQFGATSYDGVTLTNTAGAPAAGYSAFGAWETSPVAGYGAVWSTLSLANRKKFLADPLNNIYLDDDGELVQVRYRVRVVQGLGDSWDQIDPQGAQGSYAKFMGYSSTSGSTSLISPRGALATATDYTAYSNTYVYRTNNNTDSPATEKVGLFVHEKISPPTTIALEDRIYAVPIALVQRRNQGAYHPVLNPHGTRKTNGPVGGSNALWYSSREFGEANITTAQCLVAQPQGVGNAGANEGTGTIASGVSGRPDAKYFDAIYADDVQDLRNSARRVTDQKRLLEKEVNRLVAGEVRGFEGQARTSKQLVEKLAKLSAVNGGEYVIENSYPYANALGDRLVIKNPTTGAWHVFEATAVFSASPASGSMYFRILGGTAAWDNTGITGSFGTTLTATWSGLKPAKHAAETLLHCDIIGDPANYFRGHYDYLSSTTSAVNTNEVVKVDSLTTGSGTVGNFYERIGANLGSTDLQTVDYTTGDWKDLGTDRAGSWVTEGVFGTPLLVDESGNSLIPDGTSKEYKLSRKATATTAPLVLTSPDNGNTWTSDFSAAIGSTNNLLYGAATATASGVLRLAFYATNANPTALAANSEVLALGDVWGGHHNLVTLGNRLVPSLIGKVADSSGANKAVHFGSPVEGYRIETHQSNELSNNVNYAPQHNGIAFNADDSPAVKVLPYLSRSNGRALLHLLYKEMVYDGVALSFGDNSQFTVLNNESTETDDNGQTVIIGQRSVELPYFIADGE